MIGALALLAATAAAPRSPPPPSLAAAEARIVASETRAATLDRVRRGKAERLARADMPTAELLAALQRAALRPPLASLAAPGSVAETLRRRAIVAAVLPVVAARTADLRRDLARSTTEQAAARAELRAARLRLAALVETMRGSEIAGAAGPDERRRIAALPAPPLRPAASPTLGPAAPVYRPPLAGDVVFGTGERLARGGRSQGVTLAAAAGAIVRAPAAGRVGYAGPFGGYGRIVILDHGHGWTSLIAGLEATGVRPGALLPAGASLGRMPATPARLTLELKHDGRAADVAAIMAWRG